MATVTTRAIGDPTRLADYQNLLHGHMSLSMTNMDSTSEPTFTGTVELNGTTLVTLSADSGTGWAGLDTSSDVWVYVQSSGAVVYSATAPSWDADKAGWYNDNDRAIAWMRKDSADGYRYKHFLPRNQASSIYFVETLDIGDWNMDTNATSSFAHELNRNNVRKFSAMIRGDAIAPTWLNLEAIDYTSGTAQGAIVFSGNPAATHLVSLRRLGGGTFDSNQFDQTSYNRGYVRLTHAVL